MFSHVDSRVPAGLAVVAVGVVLTLLSFSGHGGWNTQRLWPLLVVVFGLIRIVEQPSRLEGWVLLLVGAGIQLANFGLYILPGREVVRYWPLAVVLVGLSELMSSRSMGAKSEGFAVVFLGVWLQLSYFGAAHISSYRAWPLALTAMGGVMVWRGSYTQRSL